MNSPGLMVSTRLVPSASGLPGHVSADAGTETPATAQASNATVKRIERLALNYPTPVNVSVKTGKPSEFMKLTLRGPSTSSAALDSVHWHLSDITNMSTATGIAPH